MTNDTDARAGLVAFIRQWLDDLSQADLDDIAADGGVTVAMVYQQQARDVVIPKLDRLAIEHGVGRLANGVAGLVAEARAYLEHPPHNFPRGVSLINRLVTALDQRTMIDRFNDGDMPALQAPHGDGEPVAYRYRYYDPGTGKPIWVSNDGGTWNDQQPHETQPLYAHPAPRGDGVPAEVLERACDAYLKSIEDQGLELIDGTPAFEGGISDVQRGYLREAMRAALAAASPSPTLSREAVARITPDDLEELRVAAR